MKIITFDIKTGPDLAAGRNLYGNPADMSQLSDEDVGRVMALARLRDSGGHSEHLQPPLQRIIALSVMVADPHHHDCKPLGNADSSEAELLAAFFALLPGHCVIWDAAALAVLHYRSLLHGIAAAAYWQNPPVSLQAQLSTQTVPMHDVARVLGLPLRTAIAADKIWETWLAGDLEAIRTSSANDARLTYLLLLRYQLLRGELSQAEYQAKMAQIAEE